MDRKQESAGRNADLQGQGAPIRDDAGPPEQGWRGERVDEPSSKGEPRKHRRADGTSFDVEEFSGTAAAEASGTTGVADREAAEQERGPGPSAS